MDAPTIHGDRALSRAQTERENPFNKFECDSELNEHDLLQQIEGYSEMSADFSCVDKQTLASLGIDLSAQSSLEDFVHHFDDAIGKCFRLETVSEEDKRQRFAPSAKITGTELEAKVLHAAVTNAGSPFHSRAVWSQLVIENARQMHGWHKPFSTQLYLRSLLKQRQRLAESETSGAAHRYTSSSSTSMATESTKALLDNRRRSRFEEQCSETDENELRACFDLHSLITAELPTGLGEPFKSADEVLAEIDQLIQDGAGVCALEGDSSISPTALELLHFKELGGSTAAELESSTFASNLRNLSIGALSEYLEELEVLIRQLSEQLVQELAEREDIDFERELKSEFISLMTAVQKQQKEALTNNAPPEMRTNSKHVSSKSVSLAQHSIASVVTTAEQQWVAPSPLSRLRKISWSTSNVAHPGSASGAGTGAGAGMSGGTNANLFTQIPYHAANGPPDCELLQRFNVLLRAVVENQPNVPQLLTDYILNVYAPPPVDLQTTIKLK